MTIKVVSLIPGPTDSDTVTMNNPPRIGDLIVGHAKQNVTPTPAGTPATVPNLTSPYGLISVTGAATHHITLLKGLVVAGQSQSLVATFAGSTPPARQLNFLQVSGVSLTEDTTAVATQSSGAGTSLTTAGLTTVSAYCLLVSWFAAGGATAVGTTAPDSDWTLVGKANQSGFAYKIVKTQGTYTCGWSWAASVRAAVGIMAFPALTGIPNGDLSGTN